MKKNYKNKKPVVLITGYLGSGKTTLLNAITWCLYEEEFQTKATDADKLPEKIHHSFPLHAEEGERSRTGRRGENVSHLRPALFCGCITVRVSGISLLQPGAGHSV